MINFHRISSFMFDKLICYFSFNSSEILISLIFYFLL
nr:MAG TPA: hypothetical protein [Bacteriophage sp.]